MDVFRVGDQQARIKSKGFSRRGFVAAVAALGAVRPMRLLGSEGGSDSGEVRLGVISDTHVTGPKSAEELGKALAFLRDRRVDAVLHCGDITDFGYRDELRAFADVWRRTMPANVQLVVALGNRDLSDTNKLSPERRQADRDRLICADPSGALKDVLGVIGGAGIRGTTVKGVGVVAADWKHEGGLEDFLMAHPELRPTGRPFVCIQHPHPAGTVFGWGARGAKDVTTCILKLFPRAWSFSGHSHEPFTHGGSLWRGEFTAAAAGSYFLGSGFGGYGREVSVLTVGKRQVRLDRFDLRSGAASSSSWEEESQTFVPDGVGVFVQWNVGHFCRGRGSEPTLTSAEAVAVAADWRRVLAETGAELVGVCEYSAAVDAVGTSARQTVFGGFASFEAGSQRDYQCNALAGKGTFRNVRSGEYARRVQKTYWQAAETTFAGVETTVVETHLDFADAEIRRTQVEELIRLFGNCPRVIISGDFNVAEPYEFAAFARAGFRLANAGGFGEFPTHRRRKVDLTPVIDNVMVRGFDILDVSVVDEPLRFSDHRALRCALRPLR